MTLLPATEEQLTDAIAREIARTAPAPKATPRRRSRRTLGACLAIVAISGTAVAATRPWEPTLGNPSNPTSQDADNPPADQLKTLGVLRREATPADRDPATRATLKFVGKGSTNVHVNYIRRLGSSPGGAIVLVPAAKYTLPDTPPVLDALCLFYSDPNGDGGAKSCWSTDTVRKGEAVASLGQTIYGLVPDGVDRVTATFPGRSGLFGSSPTATVQVTDNFFQIAGPKNTQDPEPGIASRPTALDGFAPDGSLRLALRP